MPILGSSNSVANKDMMSNTWTNGDTVIWLSRKHCGERRNCLLWAISPFPTLFSKAVCSWCIKMSIYGEKGSQTWIRMLLENLWAKEKSVVTSSFSFTQNLFFLSESFNPSVRTLQLSSANVFYVEFCEFFLFWKEFLTKGSRDHQQWGFLRHLGKMPFENIVGKGKKYW